MARKPAIQKTALDFLQKLGKVNDFAKNNLQTILKKVTAHPAEFSLPNIITLNFICLKGGVDIELLKEEYQKFSHWPEPMMKTCNDFGYDEKLIRAKCADLILSYFDKIFYCGSAIAETHIKTITENPVDYVPEHELRNDNNLAESAYNPIRKLLTTLISKGEAKFMKYIKIFVDYLLSGGFGLFKGFLGFLHIPARDLPQWPDDCDDGSLITLKLPKDVIPQHVLQQALLSVELVAALLLGIDNQLTLTSVDHVQSDQLNLLSIEEEKSCGDTVQMRSPCGVKRTALEREVQDQVGEEWQNKGHINCEKKNRTSGCKRAKNREK